VDDGPDGFGEYVAARQATLLRTAWMLSGDWGHAEDLVQSAFVRMLPHWHRVRDDDPDGYAYRILMNCYLSWWRRVRPREPVPRDLPEVAVTDGGFATVALRDELSQLLATLPRRQRAVVVLRYYHEYSEAETAALLGCAVGTVKSQAAKALAKMRGQLSAAPAPVRQSR
jgi:RNA polymerase sigma-70 factor (sigma-E family)